MFQVARALAPSIIFIDEIDSIGKSRSGKFHTHGEQDSTLNSLLSEMDGFCENENVLVIAATNIIKQLDSALTRSGRFDKKIIFDPPNKSERQDMFKLYMNKISLSPVLKDKYDECAEKLAAMTAGLTGADIRNITNQAIMSYIKRKYSTDDENEKITEKIDIEGATLKDFEKAIEDVAIGMEKRERTMTDAERNVVAHHEAGHSLVAYLLQQCTPPVKVSIIPRGEAALGYSQQEQTDQKLHTKEELFARICVLLGGRVAELIMFDNKITTGASDDIDRLTKIAYDMVSKYGMSVIGEISVIENDNPYRNTISEKKKEKIDIAVSKLVNNAKKITKTLLKTHTEDLKKIAKYLLENEEITSYDLEEMFKTSSIKNSIDIGDLMDE